MIVFYILLALLVLMVLITIHEFGHYSAGKLLGFKINEFSIGFGKAIYSHTNKKTGEKFSVRLVPLGGYCSFDGEDTDGNTPGSFNKQKPWKRLVVLFSGAFFNFLFGIITVFIMLMTVGYDLPQIKNVDTSSINFGIIQENDVVYKVAGKDIFALNTFNSLLAKYQEGDKIILTVKRDGKIQELDPVQLYKVAETDENGTIKTDSEGNVVYKNVLGIQISAYKHSFVEALARSFKVSIGIAIQVLTALWGIITGSVPLSQVSGPFGTIGVMASTAQLNLSILLIFIPVISINLAVFNWLPIPALDGGRMFFVGLEAIRRKPIKREIEAMIHAVGMFILFGAVILIDVINLIF